MTREEQQLEKHFRDLARTAYQRGIAVFSDFLNLNELNIFQSLRGEFSYLETETFGGYELAERQIAIFHPEAPVFYADYPVKCLKNHPPEREVCGGSEPPGLSGGSLESGN